MDDVVLVVSAVHHFIEGQQLASLNLWVEGVYEASYICLGRVGVTHSHTVVLQWPPSVCLLQWSPYFCTIPLCLILSCVTNF
jgi:hypothetical protein